MRFTLHYEGHLPAKSKGNSQAKANVRAALEPQLRDLWKYPPLVDSDLLEPKEGSLSPVVTKHGHTFVALVAEELGLRAELDIMILRPTPPQVVDVRGDLDNQLKVLLDALSAPAQPDQLAEMRPTSPEDPMFVLLEDDRLISRVSVESERLLGASDSDVMVTIRVTTRIVKLMWGNISLG